MNAVNELPAWQRLHARDGQELEDLARLHRQRLVPDAVVRPSGVMRIRCARLKDGRLLASDLLWLQRDDETPLYTVETGHPMLWPGQARERMQAQGLALDSSHATALVLIRQLLGQTASVLGAIDEDLSLSRYASRGFLLNAGTERTRGVEDLRDIDAHLATLHAPLSFVLQSLDDLEQAGHRLRRAVFRQSRLSLDQVDELIAEIAGVQRRARFMLERQRFHREAARETVAMSDLNVVKVFTVLWAVFIPATALINWYGQNFRFMPELSWDGSLWAQLLGVLVVTAIPLLMVKQSGALR